MMDDADQFVAPTRGLPLPRFVYRAPGGTYPLMKVNPENWEHLKKITTSEFPLFYCELPTGVEFWPQNKRGGTIEEIPT